MRESDIEKHLIKRVSAAGGEVRKVKWQGRRGAPDRAILLPKIFAWVELKAPGEGLQPHQEREHHRLQRAGQVVYTLDSIEEVDFFVDTAVNASRLLCLIKEGVAGHG